MSHRLINMLTMILFATSVAAEVATPESALATLGEVEVRGQGETPLLLIPCMSCRWVQYEEFMERNLDNYTMYAVTLPGFGGTPPPDLPYEPEKLLWRSNAKRALVGLIEQRDLNDLYVVGHSYGSSFAVELAESLPERISGVINIDGFIALGRVEGIWRIPDSHSARLEVLTETENEYMLPLLDATQWRQFNKPAFYASSDRQLLYHGMFMATDRRALFAYWAENMFFDIDPILSSVKTPVLDIEAIPPNGDQQVLMKQRRAVIESAGASDNVRTVFFLRTYHFIMDQRPELLDRVIAEFVAGHVLQDVYTNDQAGTK